jgi:hypothetical protein
MIYSVTCQDISSFAEFHPRQDIVLDSDNILRAKDGSVKAGGIAKNSEDFGDRKKERALCFAETAVSGKFGEKRPRLQDQDRRSR